MPIFPNQRHLPSHKAFEEWIEKYELNDVSIPKLYFLVEEAIAFGANEEMHEICGWLDTPECSHLISPLIEARTGIASSKRET